MAGPAAEAATSTLPHFNKREKCKLAIYMERMTENERDALSAALGNTEWWSASALVKVLKQFGFSVGTTTVKTHRSRDCVCYL